MKKRCKTVMAALAAALLFVSFSSAEEAPALKKLNADVKELILYANQTEPASVTLAAEPEGASLEGLALNVKKEGIITAAAEGNVIRVLPVSAGSTTLTAEAGKVKLNLNVKVLVPAEAVTLSRKGDVAPGKKVKFTAAVEPKNAGNKNVEWSVEGTDLAEMDKNGTLSISADCRPGTRLTVRCCALGSGSPVEAAEELIVGLPLTPQTRKGLQQLNELPIPGPLLHPTADGSTWHEDFGLPEIAKVSFLSLENNLLKVKTDRNVSHIYIAEYDESWNTFAYVTTERLEGNKAELQLVNPQEHRVDVIIMEDLEVNGKMEENYSQGYKLCLEPLSLKAEAKQMGSDADGDAWAPYQMKNKKIKRLLAEIYPDGRTKNARYTFQAKNGELQISASFDEEGMLKDAYVLRYSASADEQASTSLNKDGTVKTYQISMDRYGYRLEMEDSGSGIFVWNLEEIVDGTGTRSHFRTREELFTHLEDGTVLMNTVAKDTNGEPFPWPFLADLVGPNTFAYPLIAPAAGTEQ